MAIAIPVVPEGARVRVRRGRYPVQPDLLGRTGTVIRASEYAVHLCHVVLDGDQSIHAFSPHELEVEARPALPPERERAKGLLARP